MQQQYREGAHTNTPTTTGRFVNGKIAALPQKREIDMSKVNVAGKEISMDVLVLIMQDDIREDLHRELAPCMDQEFADAYLARDPELKTAIVEGKF